MTMRIYSNQHRPQHLGPFALERLPRVETADSTGQIPRDTFSLGPWAAAEAIREYRDLYFGLLSGESAPERAPVPDDPAVRSQNLKASAYFLDVSQAGCCTLLPGEWHGHSHALLFLVEFAREPDADQPGAQWIRGTNRLRSEMRAAEVAAALAGYLRWMGYSAQGHASPDGGFDLARAAVRAGLVLPDDAGVLRAPFLHRGFAIGAVTTDYALAADLPLAPEAFAKVDAEVYMGVGGTQPGWHYAEEAKRPLHVGRYPMETIARVDEPTTLVLAEQIRRVSKRADFFKRAQAGDLGPRAAHERQRFAMKHPMSLGMRPLLNAMVPIQGTREKLEPTGFGGDLSDPQANADAMKAFGHYLGADFVAVCRAEPWMYYSHDEVEGSPIEPYHPYVVVMLIDQGFDTMEGASGDDWISATQSMRGYLRGAEIAGIMAAHCREMGHSARVHSNLHSELIHNPAILMAGLGEVSRIGDTLLNPFIGPRSKSVLFTTDLPLAIDRPIDFGLQDFCGQCKKCARECPCNAIPFGEKLMFNGYETWKGDVEKCSKYRLTQSRGSACGRCMKMCPWNREDTLEGRRLTLLSIEQPEARPAIIAMDDILQNGRRNLIKKWWFDLEVVDGVAISPAGTNERDLSFERAEKLEELQRLALFPPELQPAGGTTLETTVPVDRTAGRAAYEAAEPAEVARLRYGRVRPAAS